MGKLYQRGDYGLLKLEGQHPKLASDFVSAFDSFFQQQDIDSTLLRTLVQRHHRNANAFPPELLVQETPEDNNQRALAYLISEADHLSAAERGLHEHGAFRDFKTVPLGCIFRSLEVKDRAPNGPSNHNAAAITDVASLDKAFPVDLPEYRPGELTGLIKDFGSEFNKRLKPELTGDFQSLLAHLINILYRYTWCVPADTQEQNPDISLYDHLRTTCAIAACLYQKHLGKSGSTLENAIKTEHEPEFLLAAGDVSDIQNYIFGISHIGEGGVARRLRARSLMVQLFTEAAARAVLDSLGLPQACQLMAAGGNFYLLLPNTPNVVQELQRASQENDAWSLKELHGEITLNLVWVTMGRDGFHGTSANKTGGFGDVLRQVNDKLQQHKRQRFHAALSNATGWDEQGFMLDVQYKGEGLCPSCRRFPSAGDDIENLCHWCRTDKKTGARLPKAKSIRLSRQSRLPIALPGGWSAEIDPPRRELLDGDIVTQLNRFDLEDYGRREASGRFMANHVPDGPSDEKHGKTQVLTFEDIASESRGRPVLGFLKMDVDNLGELLVFGLKRTQGPHLDTIARIMTLSRSLETFFSGWVQNLLERDFLLCYSIFSGGDDLFVAGPWDQVLDLAARVREDFRRWVGRDDVTISAGVVLTDPRHPISSAAEEAEEALKQSKDREEKDCITLLGHTLTWGEWASIENRW